jgi:hypothetical protein
MRRHIGGECLIRRRRLVDRRGVIDRALIPSGRLVPPGRLMPMRYLRCGGHLRCGGCLIRGGCLGVRFRPIGGRRHMSLAHRVAALRRVARLGRIGRGRLIRPVGADRGERPGDRGWPRLRERPRRPGNARRDGLRRRPHPRRCGHPGGRKRPRMRHHHGLGNHSWLRKRRRRRLPRQLLPPRWPIVHRSANGYLPYRSGCWQLDGPGERRRDNCKKSVRDATPWLPLTALTSIPSISGTNRM